MSHAVQMPAWSSIFKAQLRRTAGTRLHLGWILLALIAVQVVALGSTGVVFGVSLAQETVSEGGGTLASPAAMSRFESFGFGNQLDQGLAAVWLAGIASLLWAAFWPARVWSGETTSRRDDHWAMPIRANYHDLTRVLAGAVWVLLVSAGLVSVAMLTALLFGHATLFPRLSPWFWINLVVAPLLVYALASVVYVRAKALPFAWLWGGVLGLGLLLNVLAEWAPGLLSSVVRPLIGGTYGFVRILFFPLFTEVLGRSTTQGFQQMLGWALWTMVIGAALWIAASQRPND